MRLAKSGKEPASYVWSFVQQTHDLELAQYHLLQCDRLFQPWLNKQIEDNIGLEKIGAWQKFRQLQWIISYLNIFAAPWLAQRILVMIAVKLRLKTILIAHAHAQQPCSEVTDI